MGARGPSFSPAAGSPSRNASAQLPFPGLPRPLLIHSIIYPRQIHVKKKHACKTGLPRQTPEEP
ncbi:hypothetical protein D7X33_13300 [Butyricicoccus sp. 1XD8-22]|nr:hypothetical protein D7X33_13300 [Butyricicoccus sp. 1XD8-22]